MRNLLKKQVSVAMILFALFTISCKKSNDDNNDNGGGTVVGNQHEKGAIITIEKNGEKKDYEALSIGGGGVVSGSNYAFTSLGYVNDQGNVTSMTIDIRFGNETPSTGTYSLTDDGFNVGENSFITVRESTSANFDYESISGNIKIHRFTDSNGKIYFELDGVFSEMQNSQSVNDNVKIYGYVKGD